MRRDPAAVPEDLVAGVREHTDAAGEAEIRAALAGLGPAEEKRLRRLLQSPDTGRFGPAAWADLARGTDAQVAAARELSGYYVLLAERDALAAGLSRPAAGSAKKQRAARAQHLLGLFAYHRDAPLVARSLRVSLEELNAELEDLRIRHKAYRLARGTDAQMPIASPVSAPSGPPVRRRSRRAPSPPPPPAPLPETEAGKLKAVLGELGPRRALLAARLGVSGRALLARFRAAGLERELALRERDLIRALFSRHQGSEAKIAAELQVSAEDLRDLVVERGLSRELESLRHRFRREALRRRWPKDRIEQVLDRRDELRELGILEGLEREVSVRAGVIWNSLQGKPDALGLFAKKLRLSREHAVRLQKLLHLS
jgi:hypothetical protein